MGVQIGGLPVACNRDCGATCALVAKGGASGEIQLSRNPLNHSLKIPCPRGLRAIESRNAEDRIRKPLLRSGPRGSGDFRELSWGEALKRIADGLGEIIGNHGAESILDFGGSGACKGALHNTNLLPSRFLNSLGPVTRMEGSYSFQASSFVLPFAYGTESIGYDTRTLMDTRFLLLWGANVSDTRFGNETEQVIRHVKAEGGEVIVLDPRRTRTVRELGTEWIPLKPGTDAAAMLAIAWVIRSEGLEDSSFLHTYVHGAEDFFRYIEGTADGIPKDPTWASELCGIPSETIRNLALRYAAAKPAALVPGFSIQRTWGGEEAFRMAVALQALTGNAGKKGGTPGTNMWSGLPGPEIQKIPVPTSEGSRIPKAIWPRAILGGKSAGYSSDIKAAYIAGNNYLNQGSDISANTAAFETLDLIICHELYLTPTAQYADIVLPSTHYLEREDVIQAEDNYLYYSAKVFAPIGSARNDFDIFEDLSGMLGKGQAFSEGLSKEDWVNRIIDGSDIGIGGREKFKCEGIFDPGEHERNGLSSFIRNPIQNPLKTPSGKIEISSEDYAKTGFSAWPVFRPLPSEEGRHLMLITPHGRLRINSTGSNIPWIEEGEPLELWLNPRDAEERGISNGDMVQVDSESGVMSLTALVTENIMRGVVSCIEGGWFNRGTAGSVNQVTALEPTLPSIGPRTHSTFVEVSAQGR